MKRPPRVLLLVAFAGFITLGVPNAVLGVAWERMHVDLGVSLGSLGLLLIAGTIGFSGASLISERVALHLGLGRTLLISNGIMLLALLGYSLAPAWWFVLLMGLLSGLSGGLTDSSLNIYVATNASARVTNWMHGFFGVGATLGPLIMTGVFAADRGWRLGYGIVAVLQVVIVVCFVLTHNLWQTVQLQPSESETADDPPADFWRHPAVWIGVALFFLYTGNEIAAGQWSFTLLRGRGLAETTAGTWVSVYWASLTVGRFLFGLIGEWIGVRRLLRGVIATVLVGSLLLWSNLNPVVSAIGLVLMGLGNAPIFPLLISTTPDRVGRRLAARTVGFEVAAAGIGGAILPGLTGVLADGVGREMIALSLVVMAAAQVILYEVARRR